MKWQAPKPNAGTLFWDFPLKNNGAVRSHGFCGYALLAFAFTESWGCSFARGRLRASIAMSIADFGVEIEVQERSSLWCDRIRAEKLGGDARLLGRENQR